MSTPVSVRRETVVLPTYEPQAPDRNPMFLEKRVYQGSSGRVYPLPFTDRIAERPTPHTWEAVFLENEFLRVMILPELGGRIHRATDKTNGYDFIYHQAVIKPALVGLAGPWISGGIEFNWPQHHRPSTFMPADVHIEPHADGAATVWLSEHDPMARMKGMHGVCLHPGRAYLELKVRAYNRTADVQTFLWWANVATKVHEQYQSFFPPDVQYVADHARRAMSTYPLCTGRYYGVDYAARGRAGVPAGEVPRQFVPPRCNPKLKPQNPKLPDYRPDDLSWYANIPVPTSYMCMGSQADFFGGYDHAAQAGLVHIADHHISPGKKQWTWGNHEFGYAWDRNLTDPDENGAFWPYIELMAGVYTDNQPDFSFLQPGETKTWSQYWYPIRAIGPAQHANLDAAVSLRVGAGTARVGVAVSAPQAGTNVRLEARGKLLAEWTQDLAPDKPFVAEAKLTRGRRATDLILRVTTEGGRELIHYQPRDWPRGRVPLPASEPLPPAETASADELFLTGLHLEQYRHATRLPETYWREALRRDPGDARCNLALGRWHLRRGKPADAEKYLRASVARLTRRNPNPSDGEPYYQLGRCLRLQADAVTAAAQPATQNSKLKPQNLLAQAYDAFFKATWNHAWQAAGYHALAEIDGTRRDWATALAHLDRALRVNTDNLRARDLKVVALRHLERDAEATELLKATLALDPLDWWAHHLNRSELRCDTQVRLDLALDYARAGCFFQALDVLGEARPEPHSGTAPLVEYYRGWLHTRLGDKTAARHAYAAAAKAPPDYCFPARLEEIAILEAAIAANPRDARAPFYLGNLLYDRRRHREAIARWEQAVRLEPGNAVAWRNLGIGCFNVLRQPARARAAYERAFKAAPGDARLLFERDQLWKRLGESPARRLRELEKHPHLAKARDDLSVKLCALYSQTGRPEQALAIVGSRKFQPWESGEGQALGQHVRTHLLLGRTALASGDAAKARRLFEKALAAPENLGEAKHLLANQSDIHFWLGEACAAAGDLTAARAHWTSAATFRGDFQEMSVRQFSEMTYYSAFAWQRLGRKTRAQKLLRELLAHARRLARTKAKIDYFATSLPTMLLFEDDLQARQTTAALFLEAQARLGLGQRAAARKLLRKVLARDPSHALAADLAASI
ncbi:MAG: DUF5107 domain-containing protein [Bryobacteraceae bacterium]|jgi:tetratricopeptide (TPR) repeat protein